MTNGSEVTRSKCTTEQLDSPGEEYTRACPFELVPDFFFQVCFRVPEKYRTLYRRLLNNPLHHTTKRERHSAKKKLLGYLPTSCGAKCRLQCYLRESPDDVASGLVYGTEWWCWSIYIPAYGL